jgi:hypothetical protein
MAQRACRLARRDPTDTTGDVARAKDALNDAYLSVLDGGELWDFLEAEGTFTATSATDLYSYATISATVAEVLALIDDTSGNPLTPLSWEALERATSSTQFLATPAAPQYWAKWDSRVRLYPQPDTNYTISWFGRLAVAALANDTDVPVIPLSYRHRILTPLAAAQLLRMESGFQADYAASSYEAQAQQAIAQMRVAHGSAKRPNEGVISPGYGRDWPPVDAEAWFG